jgi:hypothetical protein
MRCETSTRLKRRNGWMLLLLSKSIAGLLNFRQEVDGKGMPSYPCRCATQWLGSAGSPFFGAHAKQLVHDISSSSDLSATRKRAASPPVTLRWSKVSDNGSTRLTAGWPRYATARWEIEVASMRLPQTATEWQCRMNFIRRGTRDGKTAIWEAVFNAAPADQDVDINHRKQYDHPVELVAEKSTTCECHWTYSYPSHPGQPPDACNYPIVYATDLRHAVAGLL